MTINCLAAKGYNINKNSKFFLLFNTKFPQCFNLLVDKHYVCHGLGVHKCMNMNLIERLF